MNYQACALFSALHEQIDTSASTLRKWKASNARVMAETLALLDIFNINQRLAVRDGTLSPKQSMYIWTSLGVSVSCVLQEGGPAEWLKILHFEERNRRDG